MQWVGVKRFLRALLLTALIVGAMFLLWWLALRAGYFVPVIFGKGIAECCLLVSDAVWCNGIATHAHEGGKCAQSEAVRFSRLFSTVVVRLLLWLATCMQAM